MSTITSGELKIIEANVNGIGNKEPFVKDFLKRRKKKADIFCIVEHKQTDNSKLLERFASGSYRVGASDCRRTGSSGGGVALLVHEKLTGVQDAEDKFEKEFEFARAKSIEIAAVELKVKPKDCQNGLFIFGIYRRPGNKSPFSDFISLICALVQKVDGNHKSVAIFAGDFNVNNNKEGQNTRSKNVQKQLMWIENLGYKLTHSTPSHKQGSTLNNFLVPTIMKYSYKTLNEGFRMPKKVKDSDHVPIQIIVTLESPRIPDLPQNKQHSLRHQVSFTFDENVPSTSTTEHLARETRQSANRGDSTFDINTPNTSTTQVKRKLWSEDEDGVITILDESDDEEDMTSPSNQNQTQSQSLKQGQLNLLPIGHDVSLTRVKIEGERRKSRVDMQHVPKPAGENSKTVAPNATYPSENASQSIRQAVTSNNTSTISSQSSSFQGLPISSTSQSFLQSTPVDSSFCNRQPVVINVSSGSRMIQRNEFVNPPDPQIPLVTSRPLQPMAGIQGEVDRSYNCVVEETVPIVTTERTYREVQTVRPEPSSRPAPYPQVQGATGGRYHDLKNQLDELLERKRLKERELQVITELSEMQRQQFRILGEMNKSQ